MEVPLREGQLYISLSLEGRLLVEHVIMYVKGLGWSLKIVFSVCSTGLFVGDEQRIVET